jgi:hypothetical protein
MSIAEVFNPRLSQVAADAEHAKLEYASARVRGPELYSVIAIGLATFIGSVLAGSIVMAINFRLLGKRDRMLPTIAAGIGGTAILLGMAFALPSGTAGIILVIAQVALARLIATKTQGEFIDAHLRAGGSIAPRWKAAAIGGICMAGLLLIILVVAFAV